MEMEFARRLNTGSTSGSPSRPSTASSTSTQRLSEAFSLGETSFGGLEDPFSSQPSPKQRRRSDRVYGDRFIPERSTGLDLGTSYQLLGGGDHASPSRTKAKRKTESFDVESTKEEANRTFNALLKSELFGRHQNTLSQSTSLPALASVANDGTSLNATPRYSSSTSGHPIATPPSTPTQKNLFAFSSPSRKRRLSIGGPLSIDSPTHEKYSISPVTTDSQRLLLSPRKIPRNLSKVPYKVLDAPELADDFYLNLVDWSSNNTLGVGLGQTVYLWSAQTSKVTKLCDFNDRNDPVTSIAWIQRGTSIAIGANSGIVEIWDAETQQLTRTMRGHQARVGSMAWNEHILTSGGRDRTIFHRDVRIPDHYVKKLQGHKQEVCGLKWSPDGTQLASGGNDNKLFVWDGVRSETPLWKFSEHQAAVKAIAWNPHQSGILASGGGTADKKIRFWNTLTGTMLSEVDTGSQICNLLFSSTSAELVSTHGFSNGAVQNQVVIWKYPSMQQVATLTGHTFRVLYLSASPDGRTIVTGAGDETLRFWDCFKATPKNTTINRSMLDPLASIR